MMKKKKKIIISIVLLAAAILLVGVLAGRLERLWKVPEEEEGEDYDDYDNILYIGDDEYYYDHSIETFLFAGTDGTGNDKGTGEDYKGSMADFLLLMVIDHTEDSFGYLQIDRNTITPVNMIDDTGEVLGDTEEQICTAHSYGINPVQSAENTVEAVKMLVGEIENINGYYIINMNEIGLLNEAVGGVEVTLEEDMTSIDPSFTKGKTVTLHDDQAGQYLRARMSMKDERNVSRMRRQRTYMENLFAKIAKMVFEKPKSANDLWKSLQTFATTDMSAKNFSKVAESMRVHKNKGFLSYEGKTKLGTILEDGKKHEEFYPDTKSQAKVLTELFSLKKIEYDDDEE